MSKQPCFQFLMPVISTDECSASPLELKEIGILIFSIPPLTFLYGMELVSSKPRTQCSTTSTDIAEICPHFQPVVQELKDKIDHEKWAPLFEEAILCTRKYDLVHMRHIVSLHAYLTDINEWLFWIPQENSGGEACYHRIAAFYLVLNQAPLKSLQSGCSRDDFDKPLTWLSQWLTRYALALGSFLDSPASISTISTHSFRTSFRLADYVEPEGGWPSFNSLFARQIKPSLRLIEYPSDPAAVVSPADCRFEGCMKICRQSTVTTKHIEWKVQRLIGNSEYRGRFTGGKFLHASLAPNDYHRFHTPLSGRVLEATVMPGQAALELILKYDKLGSAFLDFREAMDAPGFQAAQARGVIVLQTDIGLVIVAAIGMAQVSSVILTIQQDQILHKGEEMGYFQYGGSDIVLMFERVCNMQLSAEIGDHWKMGRSIGRAMFTSV